jgi:AAA+ superfamily predicted ATPase
VAAQPAGARWPAARSKDLPLMAADDLERVLERYRELYADDADVVNAGLSELDHELQRQGAMG